MLCALCLIRRHGTKVCSLSLHRFEKDLIQKTVEKKKIIYYYNVNVLPKKFESENSSELLLEKRYFLFFWMNQFAFYSRKLFAFRSCGPLDAASIERLWVVWFPRLDIKLS